MKQKQGHIWRVSVVSTKIYKASLVYKMQTTGDKYKNKHLPWTNLRHQTLAPSDQMDDFYSDMFN